MNLGKKKQQEKNNTVKSDKGKLDNDVKNVKCLFL